MIAFDECQQLDGENVFYALSRLRSTRVKYQLQAHATCNPDPDSFLMQFVESSLDEYRVPVRKDHYDERYFVKDKDGIVFYDTLKEAQTIHGSGEDSPVKSFLYIPGSVIDNPRGLEQNKDYISTLKALPPVESRRLLYGAWVREQSSGFYQRAWSKLVFDVPYGTRKVRGFDMAGSLVDEVNKDPDYSATVLLSKSKESRYTVESAERIRERFHTVEQWIFDMHESDPASITYVLPIDPGAAGKAYASGLQRQLAERGRHCVLQPVSTKSKLIRFRPLASIAQAGYLDVLSDDWNEWFFNELESFQGDGKTHDDALDAAVSAFWYLNKSNELPQFTLPDLHQSNNYSNLGFSQPDLPIGDAPRIIQGEFQ